MASRLLLGWTRIDDAKGGIVHMFREPIRFGKQLRVKVTTLMYR
jgi:hypothetical protein